MDIGVLINQVTLSNENYVDNIQEQFRGYFGLYVLYLSQHCQLIVSYLWEDFNIEFGIINVQGKESKHSPLKQELKGNTNRSNKKKTAEENGIRLHAKM